jgi:hypothetical protein
VEIEGSSDGDHWLVLKNNAYVFDFSGDQKVQLTDIRYPETNYRYLRIKIWNYAEPPLELEEVSLFYTKTNHPPRSILSSQLLSRLEDSKLRATICVLDLGFANLPSDLIVLTTPEANFSRLVEIQGSNDEKEWKSYLHSEYYRFHTAKYEVEKQSFWYPEGRDRYLKILVYNYDDPPLQLAQFQVQGIEKALIFKPDSSRAYTLFYGNEHAPAPRYDIEKTQNYLSVETLSKVKLEKEQPNREFHLGVSDSPWTERHPVFFWAALVVLVFGLGAYIVKLMGKVNA